MVSEVPFIGRSQNDSANFCISILSRSLPEWQTPPLLLQRVSLAEVHSLQWLPRESPRRRCARVDPEGYSIPTGSFRRGSSLSFATDQLVTFRQPEPADPPADTFPPYREWRRS